MKNIFIVGLGGMFGSMLRYITTLFFSLSNQPLAIMSINVVGSFALGMILGMAKNRAWMEEDWKLFLATGVCGGFTTFSTFSHHSMLLLENGKIALFILYACGSVTLGGLSVWLGFKVIS